MILVDLFFLIVSILLMCLCGAAVLWAIPGERRGRLWVRGLAWAGYGMLTVLLPNLWADDLITMTVLGIYYLALGWFLYHKSRIGLLYQMVYHVLMYSSQVIAVYVSLILADTLLLEYRICGYLVGLFKNFLLLAVTFLLRELMKRRLVREQRNLKIRGMIIVPVFSMALLFLYLISGDIFFVRFGYEWLLVYCGLLIAINVYCLYFWYDVAANQELKHRYRLLQQQKELIHQYYEDMEKNYSESRKLIHDIRNHLQVLEQANKMGESHYFEDLHQMLDSLGMRFYSDNRMLNIVLNDKLKKMPREQTECSLRDVRLDFLSDMDLTTIFANLLDNAVEAGEGQPGFWLKIRGETIQDFTVVKIWNPYTGNYRPGHSQKEGHEGLGLENVRQAVEKYHGEMQIEAAEQVFSVTLMFPGG